MLKTQESINNQLDPPSDKQGASFSATEGKPLKLKIVSDVHLGYKNSDKDVV